MHASTLFGDRGLSLMVVAAAIAGLLGLPQGCYRGKEPSWRDEQGVMWETVTIPLQSVGTGFRFVTRYGGGPVLESRQGVVFSGATAVCPLPYNIGGKTNVSVHLLTAGGTYGACVRVVDRWSECILDLDRKVVLRIARLGKRCFIAPLSGELEGVSSVGSGDTLEVWVGDVLCTEVTGSPLSEEGRPLGTIRMRSGCLRWYPVP